MFFLTLVKSKNLEVMGIIEDKKKFKRTTEQKNPTNLHVVDNGNMNTYDIDKDTIKKQQSKK